MLHKFFLLMTMIFGSPSSYAHPCDSLLDEPGSITSLVWIHVDDPYQANQYDENATEIDIAELHSMDSSVNLNQPGTYRVSFEMDPKYKLGTGYYDPDIVEQGMFCRPFEGFRVNGQLLEVGTVTHGSLTEVSVRSFDQDGTIHFNERTVRDFNRRQLTIEGSLNQDIVLNGKRQVVLILKILK